MLFRFESDFAGSLRCIPMVVRMKLDAAGVKLSLRQWCAFTNDDRCLLVALPCNHDMQQAEFRSQLLKIIGERSTEPAKFLPPVPLEAWLENTEVPNVITAQAASQNVQPPTPSQWADLTPLQRFALIKLTRSSHENENFPPALEEFGLVVW